MFAERILTILPDNTPVPIRLEAPEFHEGGWRCRYSIGWPDEIRNFAGYGADAVQALHITLQMIGAEIYVSPEHESGKLVWPACGVGRGYGFPVPPSVRDVLVGDDAREF
jgi:hypothetical protein